MYMYQVCHWWATYLYRKTFSFLCFGNFYRPRVSILLGSLLLIPYLAHQSLMDAHYVYTNTRSCPPARWKAEILGFPTVYDMPILPRKCLRMHHLGRHFQKFSGGRPPDPPPTFGFFVSCQSRVPLILHNGRPCISVGLVNVITKPKYSDTWSFYPGFWPGLSIWLSLLNNSDIWLSWLSLINLDNFWAFLGAHALLSALSFQSPD